MQKKYFIFSIILCLIISCKSNAGDINGTIDIDKKIVEQKENIDKHNKQQSIKHNIANPAATRCVNDGYKLEPVIKNGVTVEYICINPETGLECEIWRYFRKECQLTR
ncbi:MAG: DUF333 domain-containing protein [Desulfamplus sp.]|nr:DUF333 domain-containing protein [Desulfamplus sp.]